MSHRHTNITCTWKRSWCCKCWWFEDKNAMVNRVLFILKIMIKTAPYGRWCDKYDCEDNDDQKPAPPHPSESSLKQENLISKSNSSRISLIFNSMHWSELEFSLNLKKHIMVMVIVMIIVMVMVMVSLKRRSGWVNITVVSCTRPVHLWLVEAKVGMRCSYSVITVKMIMAMALILKVFEGLWWWKTTPFIQLQYWQKFTPCTKLMLFPKIKWKSFPPKKLIIIAIIIIMRNFSGWGGHRNRTLWVGSSHNIFR